MLGCAVAWSLAGRRALWRGLPVALALRRWPGTSHWTSPSATARARPRTTTAGTDSRPPPRPSTAILRPEETYVASKEVAWYARNKQYVDQESWQHVVWEVQHAEFDGTYLGHDIRVLALEVGEPTLRRAYDGLLLGRGYAIAGEYGNFLIYVRS